MAESRLEHLGERELAVLALMAEGHTNAHIADLLCVSLRTVETHASSIYRKLELGCSRVHSRVAAVLVYLDARTSG